MATRKEIKEAAQAMLMHGIGNVLGYWSEDASNTQIVEELGVSEQEFRDELWRQADRAARTLGFKEAWSS